MRRLPVQMIGLSLICASLSFAQHDPLRTAFQTIDSLYNSGSYLRAEVEARRLLEYANLNDTMYVEIHKYIAYALIAQGKTDLGKERFAMLLSLSPAYTLDPVLTSPKILAVFNEAKRDFISTKRSLQEAVFNPINEHGSSVSYRSMIFPGWEQYYTGRKTSGIIFLSAGILTLGSGLTFEILRSSARQDYLSERTLAEIDNKYKIYNRYYRAEIASFAAFVITYIISEIDVITASHSTVILQSNLLPVGQSGITIALTF
ncbi:MAG: hypothetical protein EHM64_05340 [Ignavibacteriae bacterium]|nr:MAG: hypothetical protein EHM64_05340 [Ignavibacteriota bacterium]